MNFFSIKCFRYECVKKWIMNKYLRLYNVYLLRNYIILCTIFILNTVYRLSTLQRTSNLSFSGYIRGEIRFIKKTYDLLTNSWINPWMKMSSYAEEYVIYINMDKLSLKQRQKDVQKKVEDKRTDKQPNTQSAWNELRGHRGTRSNCT